MREEKRMPFVRRFVMLVMLTSLTVTGAMSATAAPGEGSKAQLARVQAADVTLDVCITLLDTGLIGVDGTGAGDTDLAATDLPAGIALDVTALASVNAGECGLVEGFPPVPGGEPTFETCDALDISNDRAVDATEAVGISIDLDGDGDVDASEPPLADEQCDAILAAVPGADPTVVDGAPESTEVTEVTTDVDGTTESGEVITDVDGTTDGTETEAGSLAIDSFACPQVEVPVAMVFDPGVVSPLDGAVEEGCVATSADFQIFVNGNFDSDPIEVSVDESGTFNGIPPTQDGVQHALFEPAFDVYFSIEIAPGEVTTATVLNPTGNGIVAEGVAGGAADNADSVTASDGNAEVDTSVAGGAADNAGGAISSDGNAESDTSNVTGASDDGTEGGIISLPSTGQGDDGGVNGSAIVLLFGMISMVALAGGLAWRQRRTS